MKTENTCLQYTPTLRERIGWKLFPGQFCDLPDKPGMKDVVVTRTKVELSFLDRLRVLFSGRLMVEAKTCTENVVGSTDTHAAFSALPPRWLSR